MPRSISRSNCISGKAASGSAAQERIDAYFGDKPRPCYDGELPDGNDGLGLGLLGISGDRVVDAETYAKIRQRTLESGRGTVQADILKEDQAQNTCIFSTEFAMKMMGDVQQYFIDNNVRNYYSVSISGYHIAEAGRTRSASSRLRWPTVSQSSSITWHAAWISTISRQT